MYLAFLSSGLLVATQKHTMAITASHHAKGINQFNTQPLLLTANLPSIALGQRSTNFSLLVGEWSERGKCNAIRYIFKRDGRYQFLERKQGQWKTYFNGVYVPTVANMIAVSESEGTGGDGLDISKLTPTMLTGRWIIEYEYEKNSTSWIRCPSR